MAYGTYLNSRNRWWFRLTDPWLVWWDQASEKARLRDISRRMRIGRDVYLRPGLVVHHPEHVTLADEVAINHDVTIMAHAPVSIGRYTMIAPGVMITTVHHDYAVRGRQGWNAHRTDPVEIGSNVWIGAGALILPGVRIGDGAVIGAGSVVTKDVEPDAVVVGVPARFLKWRTHEPRASAARV